MKLICAAAVTLALLIDGTQAFTNHKLGNARQPSFVGIKVDGRTVEGGAVQPANNFILVKKADAVEKTEGGILLTGKAKVVKTEGTVVSVGPGKTHPETGAVFDMPVAPGEGVVYGKYDGTEIDIDGVKHTLIRDDDVLVKFTGDKLTLDSADVIRDAVLVHVETKETATEGGILIAKTSKSERKPSTGKVVKVGPGRFATNGEKMEMEVQPGDFVKFRDFAGNEVEIEGQEYSVVRMADILARF
jgi:chaperonin GroES